MEPLPAEPVVLGAQYISTLVELPGGIAISSSWPPKGYEKLSERMRALPLPQ